MARRISTANKVVKVHLQRICRFKIIPVLVLICLLPATVPVSALAAKRVGIVYSETSADAFYDKFSYSQLFMAMQHQAMMAGIPFDLLTEDDLADSAKLSGYAALIIPPLENAANAEAVAAALQTASKNGVGIITGGVLLSPETMAQIFGIEPAGGAYGVAATVIAGDISHPAMRGYTLEENIGQYAAVWFNSYRPVDPTTATPLARIQADGRSYNGVLAVVNGGRHVHFANDQIMGDWNLVWSALQWVVFGETTPVALKLGREQSIFVGRNDMDASMFGDDLHLTDIPLLDLLTAWKQAYNFVGSYYLNIGNNLAADEYTVWQVSRPLFRAYMEQGNEIGTHSYTHPDYTGQLSAAELEFEFNQSKLEIEAQLGNQVTGAAIPGNPETLDVDRQLNNYFQYVSGRSSVVGSGYPGAFGYLSPAYDMLYFSLNLSPDYTLIEWLGYRPADALRIWIDEYAAAQRHASLPIIHWLWHDYGPTIESTNLYSVGMYEGIIAAAYHGGSEFATADDIQKRIRALQAASLNVEDAGALTVEVAADAVGQFSLEVVSDRIIARVDNWYAYDQHQVFIPENGGRFIIRRGIIQSNVTRIVDLPMRSKLINLNGDGTALEFSFEGEGTVTAELNPVVASDLKVQGADSTTLDGTTLKMHFNRFGQHSAAISPASTTDRAPQAESRSLETDEDVPLAIVLSGSDPDADPITLRVIANPSHGTLSGTPPNLTYTPHTGFAGYDSFEFVADDGRLESSPATITITVKGVNKPPVAEAQTLTTIESEPLGVTLSAADPEQDPLTFQITSPPAHGMLSGTPPNMIYTPQEGFTGQDDFAFTAHDGTLESLPAVITVTVIAAGSQDESNINYTTGIVVDGNLADWETLVSFGPDPDDISGAANYLDWREGWMAHDDTNFYLAVRNDSAIELSWAYNVYLDTDCRAATGYRHSSQFAIGSEYVLQGEHLFQYTGDGESWSWRFVATLSQAVNGTQLEYLIPRADIGNPDRLRLIFYGDNNAYADQAPLDLYPDQAMTAGAERRFFSYSTIPADNPPPVADNRPPVAEDQILTMTMGTSISIILSAADPDGDALSFRVISGPIGGTLSGTAPTLTYTPNALFFGNDSFTFTANDGVSDSNPGTIYITVIPSGGCSWP